MSGLIKSSKVALEIFLTHTFCISSVKYYESGELILIKKEVFEKREIAARPFPMEYPELDIYPVLAEDICPNDSENDSITDV